MAHKAKEYDTETVIPINDLFKGMFFRFVGGKTTYVVDSRGRGVISYYKFDDICAFGELKKKTSKRKILVGFEF